MADWNADFGPFDGHTWLNCADQGPLPKRAVEAVDDAVTLKRAPHRVPEQAFREVPAGVKRALGTLINASPDEIILGNSFSYGLHLLIHGLEWNEGDEVILVEGDFPATILPWRLLESQGVQLRFVDAECSTPLTQQLAETATPRTRAVCTTWVDSFTGRRLDIDEIGTVCHEHDVLFVLNGSQGVGARPIDVSRTPVDVLISCGYKWLCGPYGTGFTWLTPEVLDALGPVNAYWLSMQAGTTLDEMQNLSLDTELGASGYDVFGTANFNNFMPWTAAVEYLTGIGIEQISAHGERLVGQLIEGAESSSFEVVTPEDPQRHANIVVLSHSSESVARETHRALADAGIHTALREGNIRVSPHVYNTHAEIDGLVERLPK
ncbi:aminotransferase class V-fold PLP-dependent enzyme [Haloferax volcanii]|uniref:Aminotransferase class V-fold PLP-dependent enzyme n=1 Tax=Haloferax volcanii TaxID=2246 RepID=A0A6C0UQP0_HALVO|nr:aminotransferase class V-fold PLP-dependent enzyme [Haloferax alexandrinus]QIB77795.1 aminotransferase class V-fold PLP-dependent enzyme [Haloferax alexandrinus]